MAESARVDDRRKLTRNRIFQYIYESKMPITKQMIAQDLGFSLPTINKNIAEFLEKGVIRPGEFQESSGGRRPLGYVVNNSAFFAVGASVSAHHIRFLAQDLSQNEIAYLSLRRTFEDGESLGNLICTELKKFMKANQLDDTKLIGVGITVPGVVDRNDGTLIFSPTLHIRNLNLQEVTDSIPYPCHVENDSTSAGFTEWSMSEDRQRNMAYLHWGIGVGGTISIGGNFYEGDNFRSGEFGHMCIVPNGRPCSCGKRGCLEAYISESRMSSDLDISLEEFFEGLAQGNTAYKEIWDGILEYLAQAICNIRMVVDCDIVIGGSVSGQLGPYLDRLKELLEEKNPFENNSDFLRLGKLLKNDDLTGGARYFIRDFIEKI